MISFQLLGTAAAAALVGSTVSASSLPQRRAVPNGFPDTLATIIETSAGNETFLNLQYCRSAGFNARGWAEPDAPVNMSMFDYPCDLEDFPDRCTLIESIGTNLSSDEWVYWTADVPVNVTYQFVLLQRADNGTVVTKSTLFTTVPPIDGTDCDQSLLSLPLSAASLSNETARIGTPVFAQAGQPTQSSSAAASQPSAQPSSSPTSGADILSAAGGYPAALALGVAGIAALL